MPSVCAVVVTYNRSELLEQLLDRLASQSRRPDAVLVVDNASQDDTPELLAARGDVEVLRLPENRGGAGGFAAGLRHAREAGHDWYWVMDDDTFPDPLCLAALVDGVERAPAHPSVMTSVVRWKDGTLHPMNQPWLKTNARSEFVRAVRAGLLPLRGATFVSTMIHRTAIDRYGLPLAHYFIWLDDMEFTCRVLNDELGYLVPGSVAVHWTDNPYNTVTDDRGRFYYKVRNHLWMVRGEAFRGTDRAWAWLNLLTGIRAYVQNHQSTTTALKIVARGLRDGARTPPTWKS